MKATLCRGECHPGNHQAAATGCRLQRRLQPPLSMLLVYAVGVPPISCSAAASQHACPQTRGMPAACNFSAGQRQENKGSRARLGIVGVDSAGRPGVLQGQLVLPHLQVGGRAVAPQQRAPAGQAERGEEGLSLKG